MEQITGINQRVYEYIKAEPPYMFRYRKVWIEHNGPIPVNMMIHHKNGNKKDDRIENLGLVSSTEHGLKHRNKWKPTAWIVSKKEK